MPSRTDEQILSREEAFKKLLDVLYEISGESFTNIDANEFIKFVVAGLKQLGFDRAGIWILNESGDKLYGTWGTGENGSLVNERARELPIDSLPPLHGYTIRITDGDFNEAGGTKLPLDIFIPKGEESRFEKIWGSRPSYPGYYARTPKGDNISLPIAVSGKNMGTICVDNFITKRRIEKEDADILAMFTANMGLILHNVRLMNEIYKQRDMERQIMQLEKMSDLGQLIAGVLHELNNPLTEVIGYSEILMNTDCDEKIKRGLAIINSEAHRCYKIATGLLGFSRQYEPRKEYIQINDVIESTLNLREYQLNLDNIELELHLPANIPRTMADPHRMQQVFMNIITNAQQAMVGYTSRGKLTVETKLKDNIIIISFSNNGPSISEENLTRIFEPFFTTKAAGKGTGLGLNICKSIIEEHDGSISVDSKEGRGVTFTINLPVTTEEPGLFYKPESDKIRAESPGIGLKILVVDDEQGILELFTELLGMFGHTTIAVGNGNQAMEKINNEKYDLIICDIKMPGLGGEQLYELIKSKDQKLAERVIFITGDVVNPETQKFLQDTGNLYISKPFAIEEIKQIITRADTRI